MFRVELELACSRFFLQSALVSPLRGAPITEASKRRFEAVHDQLCSAVVFCDYPSHSQSTERSTLIHFV